MPYISIWVHLVWTTKNREPSRVSEVLRYIKHQEQNHNKETFQEEYNEFMSKYNFGVYKG